MERYGAEMVDSFVRERAFLRRTEGRIKALGFSLHACFDVTREGLKARRSGRQARHSSAAGAGPTNRGPAPRKTGLSRIGDTPASSDRTPSST